MAIERPWDGWCELHDVGGPPQPVLDVALVLPSASRPTRSCRLQSQSCQNLTTAGLVWRMIELCCHAAAGLPPCRYGCGKVAHVLAQGLYGCETREACQEQLRPSRTQGKSKINNKVPLELSSYYAAEAVCVLPFDSCAVRDPRLEVAIRRTRWFITLANKVSLVL